MGVFEKALKRAGELLAYIPQRPPVVVVDAFYGVRGDESYTGYTVPAGGMFVAEGELDECAMIENMAQSAALRVGWICTAEGQPVPLGFIGSVGKCTLRRRAMVGEELLTTVRVVAEIGKVTLADAYIRTREADEDLCRCTLKIFLQQ